MRHWLIPLERVGSRHAYHYRFEVHGIDQLSGEEVSAPW